MELNATKYPNSSRVITGASLLFPNDSIILCNTSAAPVTMTLLTIPAGFWQQTWKLYVLDNSNNAGTHSITINAPSGTTINGSTSLVINVNGGGCVVTITSDTTFNGLLNYSTGGGGSALTIADALGDITTNSTKITFTNATVVATSPTEASVTTTASGVTSITATAPLTGGTILSSGNIGIQQANAGQDGYLTQGKYNDFFNKSEKVAAANTAGNVVTECTTFRYDSIYFNVTSPSANTALITPILLDGFLAKGLPTNLANVSPSFSNTLFASGTVQLPTSIYDDGSDYNASTGIWTCPTTGRYNLSCTAQFTNSTSPDGWNTVPNGMFAIGILNSAVNQIYCGSYITITQAQQIIYLTAVVTGIQITAAVGLRVEALNQTGSAYTNTASPDDFVSFSAQRVR